jgi:hypothetical protein
MTKEQAIQHLIDREEYFLDKGITDRAADMKSIRTDIENGVLEMDDYSVINTVGIHLQRVHGT